MVKMMLYSTVITTIVSAVVATLTAYWVSKKQHEADTNTLLSDKGSHLMEQLLTYPELRPYIYDNKELSESEDAESENMRQRVLALAEMWIDFSEYVVLMKENLSEEDALSWENYLCSVYNTSTVIQKYIGDPKISRWYKKDLLILWTKECRN